MAGRSLRGLVVVAAMLALAAPAHAGLSVLDNGTIRLGVDLSQGGKLTWLSRSQGEHADNMLFEAEQSYYGGGDWHAYQDPAVVVDHTNDGHTLYVRAFDTSCECTMDTWITLRGSAAVVRNRLISFRIDTTRYQPGNAELPALYTTGLPYRIVTYDGLKPFTHAPVDDLTDRARGAFFVPDAYNTDATEHWVAAIDDAHFGVGLVEPSVTGFVVLSGNPNDYGYPSAYIAGARSELWDANVVYDYTYRLVVGSLTQIRAYAYAHRPDPRPSYVFTHDRQHFIESRTTDAGFPIQGALRVPLDQGGAVLDGPRQLWPASRVPRPAHLRPRRVALAAINRGRLVVRPGGQRVRAPVPRRP